MTKLAEQLKQGADQAWESLSEGWRELSARASGAPTRFWPSPAGPSVPGMRREEFNVERNGDVLTVWGEKRSYRDGVLRIELPKSDEARVRRVAVQTA